MPDRINLRLIEHGERVIEVDEEDYRQAKADEELDHLLDEYASNIDATTVVVEPDGTLLPVSQLGKPRPSILGVDATAAIEAAIRSATVEFGCENCRAHTTVCPRHLAEQLVEAVRQEDLVLLPREDVDAVIASAVNR